MYVSANYKDRVARLRTAGCPAESRPDLAKEGKAAFSHEITQPCNSCTAAVQLHLKCVEKDLQI